jgi:hypothetical protein
MFAKKGPKAFAQRLGLDDKPSPHVTAALAALLRKHLELYAQLGSTKGLANDFQYTAAAWDQAYQEEMVLVQKQIDNHPGWLAQEWLEYGAEQRRQQDGALDSGSDDANDLLS